MEKIVDLGLAKSIGMSNFAIEDLQDIWGVARIKSMVYQNEFKAFLQNQTPEIVEFCQKNEFWVTVFSPLGPITRTDPG
ncbi:Aldo/keto reductase family protein [Metschnikowia aff. pulcherrima]|uniref:Aldo/keto reductase family protein n=1 Tax=Metschnikowia aff. pulcherrima TaxID=2163413 RepID=A0A4P6XTN8_9ASCO|nr:Aldo/keto reductase family protein [Metschnikowia aff. pulcherrima]